MMKAASTVAQVKPFPGMSVRDTAQAIGTAITTEIAADSAGRREALLEVLQSAELRPRVVADWAAFHESLGHWRERIDWHFRQVIADPNEEENLPSQASVGGEWLPLWEDRMEEEAIDRQLLDAGFVDPFAARKRLAELTAKNGKHLKLLSDISQFYIDFYGQHVKDEGMVVHDSCACIYLVAPELFETRSGAIRVVAGGIADGQTIQKPDARSFPPGNWDGLPSQHACIGIDAEKVMALLDETLVR